MSDWRDRGAYLRFRGFLRKEFLQIRRDPSSLILALIMPVVLLILLGYGVSLNPTQVPVGWVDESQSELSRDFRARFEGNEYYQLAELPSLTVAELALEEGDICGIVHIRENFVDEVEGGGEGAIQLLLDGVDANQAQLIRGYVSATFLQWNHLRAQRARSPITNGVQVESRIWFNAASESRYFLVPGLIALIMTVVGTLLTALVIAREWERGTMEGILATPLRPREFLIGKTLPYFVLGMFGFGICVAGSKWLFHVPLRGSFWLLVLSSGLYLTAALGIGLVLSSKLRAQFVAAQASLIIGFLPAFFLSGMLFDLGSTPRGIQIVSRIVPARYFVEVSHTLFLAGDVWSVVLPSLGMLSLATLVFFVFTRRNIGLRIDK